MPLLLGYSTENAHVHNGKVRLTARSANGSQREIITDHVITATGYKVDTQRLQFLSAEIRSKLETAGGSPVLSSTFESSVPGLYFVGIAAANSFGPGMRFAFGAGFTAERLRQALVKSVSRGRSFSSVPGMASAEKEEAGTL